MKVTELLEISMRVLSLMTENGIMRDDYMYLKSYEQFINMRRNHVKYREAIRELAKENHVSQRTLERAFKRLSKEC